MAGFAGHDGDMTSESQNEQAERADLIDALATHRNFLRRTVRDLTREQATQRTTVSELCLGGLIKHTARMEERWDNFIEQGPTAIGAADAAAYETHAASFRVADDETLADLLAHYDKVARRTEDLVTTLPSLDVSHPLPPAPWFAPGARWSARRVLLHILAETAQHAGHADIVRESLDGAKTMG